MVKGNLISKIKSNKGWQLEQQCLKQPWMNQLLKSCFSDTVAWKIIEDLSRQGKNQDIVVVPKYREPFIVELKFRFVSEAIRSKRDMSIELWKDQGRVKGWPLKEVTETSYVLEIVKGPRGEPIEDEPKEVRVLPWVHFHAFVKASFNKWMNDTSGSLDVRRDSDGYPRKGAIKVRYRLPLGELKEGVSGMRILHGIHPRCHFCGNTETDSIKPNNTFWSCKEVDKCVERKG